MSNPFSSRAITLSDPARDVYSVTPSDTQNLPQTGVAFYAASGGDVHLITATGQERTIPVADFMIVPLGVSKIFATGTTANGLHVFMVS